MYSPNAQAGDEHMLRHCFELAAKSAGHGEYPYAAVLVRNGQIVAEASNRIARDHDVTRHAEMVAISLAQAALGETDLADCTLYTNFEPCAQCSYAIRESRIGRVVFAMRSPLMGGSSRWNILGDCALSDAMPEVFAPPPVVVPDFLAEEADRSLRQSAPTVWAFMHARQLLGPPGARDFVLGKAWSPRGLARVTAWILRALRRNFFDRFGRGRGKPRAGRSLTPSP
jgi:tRNA(adenine34) deaminase